MEQRKQIISVVPMVSTLESFYCISFVKHSIVQLSSFCWDKISLFILIYLFYFKWIYFCNNFKTSINDLKFLFYITLFYCLCPTSLIQFFLLFFNLYFIKTKLSYNQYATGYILQSTIWFQVDVVEINRIRWKDEQ